MEVAVTMPSSSNILERLRWKVALGLVIVAAGFAAQAAPSGTPAHEVARSSWGAAAESADVARSSWSAAAESADVARSSWGAAAESADLA
jgi:hypothetical protein